MLVGDGGGGDGFQVVMSDLVDAAATFGSEAATFKAIMPTDGPPCPDGGDAAFDENLQVVVQMIGALHLQAGGRHGGGLRQAHEGARELPPHR